MLERDDFLTLYGQASAQLLREHAQRNRERAARVQDPAQRALLLALAQQLEDFATEKEGRGSA
ncbi:MAG: hypothetical protein EXR60_00105 [Dehalococcoidia bacterium]|nr:hypothetical protein [Dehalococcoidia bacterium]